MRDQPVLEMKDAPRTQQPQHARQCVRVGTDVSRDIGGRARRVVEMIGNAQPGSSELEGKYGMVMPPDIYPIFENAMRAARGSDLETHRKAMGRLFSKFTEVAAANPYAWFPVARSAEEITTAGFRKRSRFQRIAERAANLLTRLL